jgi:hypothetical protein
MIKIHKGDELLNELAGTKDETWFTADGFHYISESKLEEVLIRMSRVEKVKLIEEGKHTGTISKVEEREEPFQYADIYIKLDEPAVEIKAGFPNRIKIDDSGKPTTKLGKFLVDMGVELKADADLDLNTLVGKKVQLMTINKETEKGTFANVVEGSIKPITSAPAPSSQ